MSIKTMFAVMDIKTGSPITKLILLKLADNANEKGECWPSLETISRICETSLRTTKTHVKKLEEMGLLSVEKRPLSRGGYSNLYRINIENLHSADNCNHGAEYSNHSADDDKNHGAGDAPKSVSSFNLSVRPKTPPTPYDELIKAYNEILCNKDDECRLKSAQVRTAKREKALKNLWNILKCDFNKTIGYFHWIRDNQSNHTWIYGNNNRNWVANLEFICRDETIAKVVEGDLYDWESAA